MCWTEARLCMPLPDSATLTQPWRDQKYESIWKSSQDHMNIWWMWYNVFLLLSLACRSYHEALSFWQRELAATSVKTNWITHWVFSCLPGGERCWTLENWDWFSLMFRTSAEMASGQMACWSFQIKDAILYKQMMPFAIILQIICGLLGNLLSILSHKFLPSDLNPPIFLLLELGLYIVSSWAVFIKLD